MTAPDKIWINWNPAVAAQGQISTEAITVLSYISTMPYPIKYTRTDLSDAIIAALVKHIADTVATSPHMNDLAQSIRALPTTFTHAELLAAAAELPEVKALVDAAKSYRDGLEQSLTSRGYEGESSMDDYSDEDAALAPFGKATE